MKLKGRQTRFAVKNSEPMGNCHLEPGHDNILLRVSNALGLFTQVGRGHFKQKTSE